MNKKAFLISQGSAFASSMTSGAFSRLDAGPGLSISPLTGDNYITAAEQGAVTISGTSRQIDDAETLTIAATDGTNNYNGTATISGNAWTSSPVADFTGWDDGPITVTVTLDSDASINGTRIATLDTSTESALLMEIGDVLLLENNDQILLEAA